MTEVKIAIISVDTIVKALKVLSVVDVERKVKVGGAVLGKLKQ